LHRQALLGLDGNAAFTTEALTWTASATNASDALVSRPKRFCRWASGHQRQIRPRRSVALHLTFNPVASYHPRTCAQNAHSIRH